MCEIVRDRNEEEGSGANIDNERGEPIVKCQRSRNCHYATTEWQNMRSERLPGLRGEGTLNASVQESSARWIRPKTVAISETVKSDV